MKHIKLLLASVIVLFAGWATAVSPNFLWRRAAFPYVSDASASGSDLVTMGCAVFRSSDGLLLKTFTFNLSVCAGSVPSPDGRFVAVGTFPPSGFGGAIRVYETSGWMQLWVIDVLGIPEWLAFSQDGRLLAVSLSGFANETRVYEVNSWTLRLTLPAIGRISISPDSQLIALRTLSNSIRLYRLDDGADVTPASGFPPANHYLLGNSWLALADDNGIRIETITEPPQTIATLEAYRIQPLAISPDARLLAGIFDAAQTGATLGLWDTQSFSGAGTWPIGSPFSTSARVAFPSNVTIIAVNRGDDIAQMDLWSVPDGRFLQSLNVDRGLYTPLVFSPDGAVVVGGFGPTGNIRAFRSSDGTPLQTIAGSHRLTSLEFANDGRHLVGAGERLNVWSWPDGDLLQSIPENTLEVAASSRELVAQRTQNEIRLRSLPELALLRTISHGGAIAFSPDGTLISVGADLFDVDSGARVQSLRLGPFSAAAFSPDGMNVIFSEVYDGDFRRGHLDRFELPSGDLLARFGRLSAFGGGGSNSLSLSPDRSRLAQMANVPTPFSDRPIFRIWDAYGLLYEHYIDEVPFSQVRYSPNGRSLALGGRSFTFGIAADPCADDACAARILPLVQLNDEFDEDRSNPGLWSVYASSGTVSTGPNGLTLRPDPGPANAVIVSSNRLFSLLNSMAKVQVAGVVGDHNVNTMFMLQVDWNNSVQWWYEASTWYAISYVDGVRNVYAERVGVPAGFTLQIREAEGTVYWETCEPSCTTRASTPTSSLFPLGGLRLLFTAATFGPGSPEPGQARYQSLNFPP